MRKLKKMLIVMRHFVFLALIMSFAGLLYASDNNLIDQLITALDNKDQVKIQEISREFVKQGDAILPAVEKGLSSDNRALKGRIITILAKIKTQNSTKTLLNIVTEQEDKYIIIDSMQVLQYRDLDFDVSQKAIEKILHDIVKNELPSAPLAARILGKMKRVNPQTRTESLLFALQREIGIH